jgi:hypothetical protein
VQLPLHLSCKGYDGFDQSVSGYKSECIFIVDAFFLRKSMSYKSCFIFLNTSISSMFYFEELFGGYHIFTLRSGNYFPYFVLYYGLVFLYHGICPFFSLNGFLKEVRLLF